MQTPLTLLKALEEGAPQVLKKDGIEASSKASSKDGSKPRGSPSGSPQGQLRDPAGDGEHWDILRDITMARM